MQKFPISIENGDPTQFTPRPAEVWVEITPLSDKTTPLSEAFVYPIYDRTLEENTPVPVLSCAAPKWPAEASFARIQVWFKLTNTPAAQSKEYKVGDVRVDNPRMPTPGGPEIEYNVTVKPANHGDGGAVIVTQTYPDQPDTWWSVKVEMTDTPDEIRREFFPAGRSVTHTFIYKNQRENELDGKRLKLTTKDSLTDGAVTLPEPLTVKILRHSAAGSPLGRN